MSTTDMDVYMAAMPVNSLERASSPTPKNTHADSTADDAPPGSSLSVAAAKRRTDGTSAVNSSSNENESPNTQADTVIAATMTPKRSNTSDMEVTADSSQMELSTDTPPMSPSIKTPPRMEEQKRNDAPVDIIANETMEEYFGVTPIHPIPLCDTTVPIVDKQQPPASESTKTQKPRRGGKNAKGKKATVTKPQATAEPLNHHPPKSVGNTVRIEVRCLPTSTSCGHRPTRCFPDLPRSCRASTHDIRGW